MTAWVCSRGALLGGVAALTGCGPMPGVPCAPAAASEGLRLKDAAKLPPRNGETAPGTWLPYEGKNGDLQAFGAAAPPHEL